MVGRGGERQSPFGLALAAIFLLFQGVGLDGLWETLPAVSFHGAFKRMTLDR